MLQPRLQRQERSSCCSSQREKEEEKERAMRENCPPSSSSFCGNGLPHVALLSPPLYGEDSHTHIFLIVQASHSRRTFSSSTAARSSFHRPRNTHTQTHTHTHRHVPSAAVSRHMVVVVAVVVLVIIVIMIPSTVAVTSITQSRMPHRCRG